MIACLGAPSFHEGSSSCANAWVVRSRIRRAVFMLFSRVTGLFGLLDLFDDLREVVARRSLKRGVLGVGLQMPQPELLPDRQQIPIIEEGGTRRGERASHTQR